MEGCVYVFSISKFNEYCGIFEEDDFSLSAVDFFRLIGHTHTFKPYLVAEDISYCIYFELGFDYRFTPQEIEYFSYIKQLSILFQLNRDVFDMVTDKVVKYYAIELSVIERDRSLIAHTIHSAFAQQSEDCTVIIFRNHKECLLSISYGEEDDKRIYLSNWINTSSDIGYIENLFAHNFSFISVIEFISDFIYYSARESYIYQLSKDYFYSQASNIEKFRIFNKFHNVGQDKFVGDGIYYDIKPYGNDYIKIEKVKDYQIKNLADIDLDLDLLELELGEISKTKISKKMNENSDNELDFDLLELELEEVLKNITFEESDKKLNDFFEDSTKVDQIDVTDIDDNILNDPIELIKWIGNNKL